MAIKRTAFEIKTQNTTYYALRFVAEREYATETSFRFWGTNGRFFVADHEVELEAGNVICGECGNSRITTSAIKSCKRISLSEFDRVTVDL